MPAELSDQAIAEGTQKVEAASGNRAVNPNERDFAPPAEEGEIDQSAGGEVAAGDGILEKFDPIVVNVFEKNSIHYLKMQLTLEFAGGTPEGIKEELTLFGPLLQDKMLFIISDRSLREILTPAGKSLLKEDLKLAFNRILKKKRFARSFLPSLPSSKRENNA